MSDLAAFTSTSRRSTKRHINAGREAGSSQRAEEATAADIHGYVNGKRSTSAQPKLEAAEVEANWAEGSRWD